jgi:vacuolar protein sorting-associated protein IST1
MAKTRINMLKNKKKMSLKVQKREIAALLKSEQDESARVKVENIIREDFTLEALDLVLLFCDTVASRVRLIDESKYVSF